MHLECKENPILYESTLQERHNALAEKQFAYVAEQLKLFNNRDLKKNKNVLRLVSLFGDTFENSLTTQGIFKIVVAYQSWMG